jgi:hypothetical protein
MTRDWIRTAASSSSSDASLADDVRRCENYTK